MSTLVRTNQNMIRLKSLLSETIIDRSWDNLIGRDVITTDNVTLTYRNDTQGKISVKSGSILRIEIAPTIRLASTVMVSYNGKLYTVAKNDLLGKSKLKK